MKKHKELVVLVFGSFCLVIILFYLSYIIAFEFNDFQELEKSSTSKQKVFYIFLFWLESKSSYLRYAWVVFQLFLGYKLLKFSFKGYKLLMKKLK